MAYLVYCPTCGGKMSVNAEVCPHCGETAFFVRHDVYVEEPCNGGYGGMWSSCKGRGWYYGLRVPLAKSEVEFEGSNLVRLKDGNTYCIESRLFDRKVAEAVRSGDYAIESFGSGTNRFWSFHYDRLVCPACGGRGTIRILGPECEWEDIRMRVE